MRTWYSLIVVAGLGTGPVTAQDFSIDEIMGAPFPSGLTVSAEHALVAWVRNAEGVRNIWVARGPEYRGRMLTRYAEDDGQELGGLAFTPDGTAIVYVRGGAGNRQGEIPNPTSSARAATRDVWRVSVAGGEPVRLASGASPAVSPRGDVVAFRRRGAVWTVPVDSGTVEQPFTIRGSARSLRWSPSGDRLAFVSARGDHAFVGVYDLATRRITYLDPTVDRDGSPVWSPDGRSIAFIRTPNVRQALPFEPRREGYPWSIVVADPDTGTGRVVWTADPGPGSVFHGVVSSNQIWWGADDRLVFPWEKNGWVNLYSIRASGSPDLRALTPGAFEVEDVTPGPEGAYVYYSSNQGDIDRRDIWRVSVRGGGPEALTSGPDIEWAPFATGEGTVAYLASGSTTPAHARVLVNGSSRPLDAEAVPSDFPRNLVTPEPVVFPAADGMPIHGQLFVPSDLRPGERRPALIFFHGGSRRQMLLGFHYRGYYHNAYALNQYFAGQGYVVLAVNYRSGIGYGLEFREAIDYGARGASEFNDVLGAGLYLRSRADVAPDRIGLWGGSYGGYLTALGLARASDLFAAGVDLHGVHDWNLVVRNFRPDYNAEARAAWARVAFESSPMAHLDGWKSPVLLIHGDDDRNVPFGETVNLVESLRQRNVTFEQLVFPDEVHGFLLHRNWLAAYRAAADFFDRTLRRGRANTGGSR